ncbi:HlyD family type I secretion periplasmic adaptor subunit [Aureimonas endophytica]|uniref:Membrane fusion protein (MFP) family protein n=1 Tax=Aureimonas endophytica TaxID=2027858 RepID=A0A917E3V1_9HYPH|nr:HlyD family type I secretion periplasmic adaptor subunit [Aureimonas endophytica]GGE01064.1 HlyD family type I secretion periplasmic adaptor subunit [Aureimonas endophytica]
MPPVPLASAAVSPSLRSIRRHLTVGVSLCLLLAGGLSTWAATAKLSGAVIAHGTLVVASSLKKVQHPTGGVVGELLVREGDRVNAGDVLVRLDATQAKANLQIVLKQIDELLARQAREQAEQTDATTVTYPADLLGRRSDPEVARIMEGEDKLFGIRREAREGQKAQLREKIAEFRQEVNGLGEQIAAKDQQLQFIDKELAGVNDLLTKKLVQFTRLAALERDKAALRGERGQYVASIAGAHGRIAEAELQIIQVDHDMRSEVSKDLADIRGKLAELGERRTAAEDQLARIDIRAPQDGIVHQLDVHTVGGVIRPGDTIMEIVPLGDELVVEARISPQDINDVHVGQAAGLRFSGVNSRTTPELDGDVHQVSADISQEQRTGASYYMVRIVIPKSQFDRMEGVRPVPGMPVEAFVKTQDRTALAYLIQPLSDQIARAFREK